MIYIYIFIGSASAADLYFCLFVYCKYGCWADLVYGIGFAAQFGGRMHVSKVDLLNFEISCFHDILLMVSDPLVLYFGTNLMHMGPYGCIRMHMEAYGCIWKLFSSILIGFPTF